MEDTIIALLNNNLRVIIPDFGAFIIRQKQPRIIVFNEFLRYNDGILIDFIVKTEGIDRDIAEQRVMDFAEDGSKLLASGREMIIQGLGSLRKDSSGKINFIEASEIIEIENKAAVEPEKRELSEEKQDVPHAIEQDVPKVIELEVPKVTEQKRPGKNESKTTSGKKSKTKKAPAKGKTVRTSKPLPKTFPADVPLQIIEPAAIEPPEAVEAAPAEPREAVEVAVVEPNASVESVIVDVSQAFEPETVSTPHLIEPISVKAPVDMVPKDIEPPKTIVPPRSSEPDGTADRPGPVSTNRILAWVLIILFVNAAILAWFVFRNKTKGTPSRKTVTTMISDTLYDQLADSVRAAAMDSSIVYDEVPVEEGNLAVNALTPGSRYYIVAGCFRDEINADSLVSSLKLLGYKAEKFGKIGNLYAVCFASFDNKDKAVSELKKIREKVPSAWMTKF